MEENRLRIKYYDERFRLSRFSSLVPVVSASIAVHLPTTLRHYCKIQSPVSVVADDVQAALGDLQRNYPALYQSICDETGKVRRHINLFVNATWVPVRDSGGLAMRLKMGDVLTIWPAVSGG